MTCRISRGWSQSAKDANTLKPPGGRKPQTKFGACSPALKTLKLYCERVSCDSFTSCWAVCGMLKKTAHIKTEKEVLCHSFWVFVSLQRSDAVVFPVCVASSWRHGAAERNHILRFTQKACRALLWTPTVCTDLYLLCVITFLVLSSLPISLSFPSHCRCGSSDSCCRVFSLQCEPVLYE